MKKQAPADERAGLSIIGSAYRLRSPTVSSGSGPNNLSADLVQLRIRMSRT